MAADSKYSSIPSTLKPCHIPATSKYSPYRKAEPEPMAIRESIVGDSATSCRTPFIK